MSEYFERLFSLRGRVAIVNSAASELGTAVVRGLAQSGAIVYGTDSPVLKATSAVTEKSWAEERLSESLKFQVLGERLYHKYGRFNLLINIEEISTPSKSSTSIDSTMAGVSTFRQKLEMQLAGISQSSRIAADYIKRSGGGSIVNIISIKNSIGTPDESSYVATKNGLLMMTKALAIELIKDNIRVNNLVIGYANDTTRLAKLEQPKPRAGDRFFQDLIATAVYFASENSNSITGQDLFLVKERALTQSV